MGQNHRLVLGYGLATCQFSNTVLAHYRIFPRHSKRQEIQAGSYSKKLAAWAGFLPTTRGAY